MSPPGQAISRWILAGVLVLISISLTPQRGETAEDDSSPPMTPQEYLAAVLPPPHPPPGSTDAAVRQRIDTLMREAAPVGIFVWEYAPTLGAALGLFGLGAALLRWRMHIYESVNVWLPTKKTMLWVSIAGVVVVLAYGAMQMWRLARCTELITSQVFLKARRLPLYQAQYRRVCGESVVEALGEE